MITNGKTIALSFALLLPSIGFAATTDNPEQNRHGQQLELLTKELNLSVEQQEQLKTIFHEEHIKFKALREEKENRIRDVLSEEQKSKYDELRKQRREKWIKKIHDHENR